MDQRAAGGVSRIGADGVPDWPHPNVVEARIVEVQHLRPVEQSAALEGRPGEQGAVLKAAPANKAPPWKVAPLIKTPRWKVAPLSAATPSKIALSNRATPWKVALLNQARTTDTRAKLKSTRAAPVRSRLMPGHKARRGEGRRRWAAATEIPGGRRRWAARMRWAVRRT
jgi:hypothetical protein